MNWQKLRVMPAVLLLLPLDIAVAVFMGVADLVWGIAAGITTRSSASTPLRNGVNGRVTIQILNWNGRDLLAECLPSVVDAAGDADVLVVDNGSTDGSLDYLRDRFPQVRTLALERNHGFIGGNHRGIATLTSDIVVLLNNDMIVDRDFLAPLLAPFATDPSVFAVTSQIFFPNSGRRREETGNTRADFERGFLRLRHDDISPRDEQQETIPVFWAGGGSCALDRRKYLAIGGFDYLYEPFYLEDTDLSYQAWKRGWKCLLAPSSKVIHKHRSTSSRFGAAFVDNTIRRNQYLFIWKNLSAGAMTVAHLLNLPRIHGQSILAQGWSFEFRAYLRAIARLPLALKRRGRSRLQSRMSDAEVFRRTRA